MRLFRITRPDSSVLNVEGDAAEVNRGTLTIYRHVDNEQTGFDYRTAVVALNRTEWSTLLQSDAGVTLK